MAAILLQGQLHYGGEA